MSERKHNFNAGPGALPLPVLEHIQQHLVDYQGLGLSLLEMSHRTADFQKVIDRATAAITELYGVPDTHEVLFLQGGASHQFAMVPLNLGSGGAYINTGTWSRKALAEARIIGEAHEVWSSEGEGYKSVPQPDAQLSIPAGVPYLHYTSNNTIAGTQYHHVPEATVPLVCDMSSDFLSRPLDVTPFDVIYAGAQKNAGPSGVTIVIIRKSVSREFRGRKDTAKILRYVTHAAEGSLYNTPNTFGIWAVALVAEWVKAEGGLAAMAEKNAAKAKLLYDLFDERSDLYRGHARPDSRSHMNVTFRMATEAQETALLTAAKAKGIIGLKGHRSVGGLRASIYNAVPMASVEVLAELMRRFEG